MLFRSLYYLAIVKGCPASADGIIKTPLIANTQTRTVSIDKKRGKAAVTIYKKIADFQAFSLLIVCPLTRRTHQLQVHLQSIDCPLAIDPIYAADRPLMLSEIKKGYRTQDIEKPLIDRLTLHCYQISIPDHAGQLQNYVAPLDKQFAAAIKMLTKYTPNSSFENENVYNSIISASPLPVETLPLER